MQLDAGLIIVALGNVGAVGVVGKYLLKSVEKSNENLPVILQAIEAHGKAIEKLLAVANDVSEIKFLHRLKRCDQLEQPEHSRRDTDDMRVQRRPE